MRQIVVIDIKKCRPSTCDYICIRVCPVNRTGKKNNPIIKEIAIKTRKKSVFPSINHDRCVRCGICVSRCFNHAIRFVNIPGEMDDEQPVFKFFGSDFSLYRLPQIHKQVVGIIGENAIGKSTLLNILAGKITPNGGYEEEEEDAFERFLSDLTIPGMRHYLRQVADGKIKVAYKRQILNDLLTLKGTPDQYMREADVDELYPFFNEILNLDVLKGKKIKQLSGGELQRFAIAMTFFRQADIYLID